MRRCLPALCARAEVVLWTDQAHWDLPPGLTVPVRTFQSDAVPWAEVQCADLSIYHLANESRCHRGILQVSRHHPGVVVLHDNDLTDLFLEASPDAGDARGQSLRLFESSEPAAPPRSSKPAAPPSGGSSHGPPVLKAVAGALAVFAHTRTLYNSLIPALKWPLACQAPADQTAAEYIAGLLCLCEEAKRHRGWSVSSYLAERVVEEMSLWVTRRTSLMSDQVARRIVSLTMGPEAA